MRSERGGMNLAGAGRGAGLVAALIVGVAAAASGDPAADVARDGDSGAVGRSRPAAVGLRWIDVGQGSALLAVTPDAAVLVDAGPPGAAEAVIHALDVHGVRRVDLWLLTHYDADHIGGVARIVAGADGRWGTDDDLEVAAFWDRGLADPPETEAMAVYLALAGDERRGVDVGDRAVLGDLALEIVLRGEGAGENERGVAARLEVSGITVLVLGDLPASAGVEAARRAGAVDILWASHHGSYDGLAPELLADADPWGVVISAGMDNAYCHPAPRVLAWLHERRVWMTGAAGLGPGERCPSLAGSMGPEHALVAGDLWMSPPP